MTWPWDEAAAVGLPPGLRERSRSPRPAAGPTRPGRASAVLLVALLGGGCGHGQAAGACDLALAGPSAWVGAVEAVGLASGFDFPGGPERLWLAEPRGVHAIGADGQDEVVWTPPRFSTIVRFEVADLDGDGVHEWVVILDQGRIRSLVVGVDSGRRSATGRPWNGFLRPFVDGQGSAGLVGQRCSGDEPFQGPIVRIERGPGGDLAARDALGLPAGLSVFDFAWLPSGPGRPARLFSFSEAGHAEERDARSPQAVIWRSDERFLARPVEIRREYRDMLGEARTTSIRLAPPAILVDEDADSSPEILVVGGAQVPVVVFEDLRVWQGGDARLLAPAARGLVELRRSPLLGRAMVAVAPWHPTPDRRVWAVAVWTRIGSGFARPESRVFLLDPATGDLPGTGP